MAKKPKTDVQRILRVLAAHRVDFIVVGAIAAVLQGAPITTFDLAIVHSRDPANLDRLAAALREMGTHFRGQGGRRIEPDRSHLELPGHQLLLTDHGPLDLPGTIDRGRDYEALAGASDGVAAGPVTIRVLDLATLIETKEEAGRDKDRAVLSILRRTLEERAKR